MNKRNFSSDLKSNYINIYKNWLLSPVNDTEYNSVPKVTFYPHFCDDKPADFSERHEGSLCDALYDEQELTIIDEFVAEQLESDRKPEMHADVFENQSQNMYHTVPELSSEHQLQFIEPTIEEIKDNIHVTDFENIYDVYTLEKTKISGMKFENPNTETDKYIGSHEIESLYFKTECGKPEQYYSEDYPNIRNSFDVTCRSINPMPDKLAREHDLPCKELTYKNVLQRDLVEKKTLNDNFYIGNSSETPQKLSEYVSKNKKMFGEEKIENLPNCEIANNLNVSGSSSNKNKCEVYNSFDNHYNNMQTESPDFSNELIELTVKNLPQSEIIGTNLFNNKDLPIIGNQKNSSESFKTNYKFEKNDIISRDILNLPSANNIHVSNLSSGVLYPNEDQLRINSYLYNHGSDILNLSQSLARNKLQQNISSNLSYTQSDVSYVDTNCIHSALNIEDKRLFDCSATNDSGIFNAKGKPLPSKRDIKKIRVKNFCFVNRSETNERKYNLRKKIPLLLSEQGLFLKNWESNILELSSNNSASRKLKQKSLKSLTSKEQIRNLEKFSQTEHNYSTLLNIQKGCGAKADTEKNLIKNDLNEESNDFNLREKTRCLPKCKLSDLIYGFSCKKLPLITSNEIIIDRDNVVVKDSGQNQCSEKNVINNLSAKFTEKGSTMIQEHPARNICCDERDSIHLSSRKQCGLKNNAELTCRKSQSRKKIVVNLQKQNKKYFTALAAIDKNKRMKTSNENKEAQSGNICSEDKIKEFVATGNDGSLVLNSKTKGRENVRKKKLGIEKSNNSAVKNMTKNLSTKIKEKNEFSAVKASVLGYWKYNESKDDNITVSLSTFTALCKGRKIPIRKQSMEKKLNSLPNELHNKVVDVNKMLKCKSDKGNKKVQKIVKKIKKCRFSSHNVLEKDNLSCITMLGKVDQSNHGHRKCASKVLLKLPLKGKGKINISSAKSDVKEHMDMDSLDKIRDMCKRSTNIITLLSHKESNQESFKNSYGKESKNRKALLLCKLPSIAQVKLKNIPHKISSKEENKKKLDELANSKSGMESSSNNLGVYPCKVAMTEKWSQEDSIRATSENKTVKETQMFVRKQTTFEDNGVIKKRKEKFTVTTHSSALGSNGQIKNKIAKYKCSKRKYDPKVTNGSIHISSKKTKFSHKTSSEHTSVESSTGCTCYNKQNVCDASLIPHPWLTQSCQNFKLTNCDQINSSKYLSSKRREVSLISSGCNEIDIEGTEDSRYINEEISQRATQNSRYNFRQSTLSKVWFYEDECEKPNLNVYKKKFTIKRKSYSVENMVTTDQLINRKENFYVCHVCNYKTLQKTSIIVHARRHTGEKPFKCSFCEYASVEQSHVVRHTKQHTGELPHKCPVCDYACIQKVSLNNHLKRYHATEFFP